VRGHGGGRRGRGEEGRGGEEAKGKKPKFPWKVSRWKAFFRVGLDLMINSIGSTFLAPLRQESGFPGPRRRGRIRQTNEYNIPILLLVDTWYVVPPERS
jgi:hypothetical protein